MSWSSKFAAGSRHLLQKSFGKHLMLTNTLTCGILLASGDVIQQKIEKARGKNASHDVQRTARMFVVGLTQGPPHHYWYVWLDKWLPQKNRKTVGLKILADQLLAAPFFAFTFFFGMGILEDRRLSECWKEFLKKFPYVYAFDWIIWPPTQFINFVWIPAAYRVLYVNVVTVIWDVFLSYIKHYDQQEQEKQPLD